MIPRAHQAQPTRPQTPTITPDEAAHVVWHFAGCAREPGEFTKQLIVLIVMADHANRRRLAAAFPGLAAAVDIAQNRPRGIRELERIAFGKPHMEQAAGSGDAPREAIAHVNAAIGALDQSVAQVTAARRELGRERRTAQ